MLALLSVIRSLQAYLARRLDVIHYQITERSLPSFLISVRLSKAEVVFISSTDLVGTYCDFLKIDNRPGIYHSQTFFSTKLIIKACRYLYTGVSSVDVIRHNFSVDMGYCGNNNSKRDASRGDLLGLSIPQLHGGLARTMNSTVQELFVAFSAAVGRLAYGFIDDIYEDNERAKLFAKRININNIIDAMRLAITNGIDVILGAHTDKNNDKDTDRMKAVACFSWNLLIDGDLVRFSLIG